MKVFILTRTVVSEKGGTQEHKPYLFLTKEDAKNGMLNDMYLEIGTFKHKLKEFYIVPECDFYKYCYKNVNLGFTTIEYKIWENEL